MPIKNRIIIAISSLLLALSYFFPLWKISLWAPQYPEGLSMQIWSSKLTGDIQTINILNHYIGMMPIDAASFSELKYYPLVIGALIGLGGLATLANRRWLCYFWTLSLVVFSLVALHDFWSWEYRFGHELNPDAAIKMEDMAYQPPLFGEKEFLNIVATAYPGIAGWAMMFTVLAAVGNSMQLVISRFKPETLSVIPKKKEGSSWAH